MPKKNTAPNPNLINLGAVPTNPMPRVNMAQTMQQKNPITNLTRTEEALLSPSEKIIAGRT